MSGSQDVYDDKLDGLDMSFVANRVVPQYLEFDNENVLLCGHVIGKIIDGQYEQILKVVLGIEEVEAIAQKMNEHYI